MRLFAVGAMCIAMAAGPAPAATIEWSLVDPFRLFSDVDEPSRVRVERLLAILAARKAAGASLSASHDVLIETLAGPGAAPLRTSHWDPVSRTYSAQYLYPRAYTVRARLIGSSPDATCYWRVGGGEQVEAPCSEAAQLTVQAVAAEGRWGARELLEVSESGGASHKLNLRIDDRLLVAIGDSFISGEGNPDVPADLSKLAPSERFSTPDWPRALKAKFDRLTVAEWWDEPCHRSLLSWPIAAGLQQAAENPHEAVTLVHLGCSGATTLKGVVGRQTELPGCPKDLDEPRFCPEDAKEAFSQLEQLKRLIESDKNRRPVDRMFVSVGGIDIGFRGLIAYALLPAKGYVLGPVVPTLLPLVSPQEIVCPYRAEPAPRGLMCRGKPRTEDRLQQLPQALSQMSKAFDDLGVSRDVVVHATYPNVMSAGAGKLCHHAPPDLNTIAFTGDSLYEAIDFIRQKPHLIGPHGFEAVQSLVPGFARWLSRWEFRFDYSDRSSCNPEAPDVRDSVICRLNWVSTSLNRQLAWAARRHGWTLLDGHETAFEGHGWCLADEKLPLALPVAQPSRMGWVWREDNTPADFRPYDAAAARWIRTANDSLLVQYGGNGRIIQGTIHPTFRGHLEYAQAALHVGTADSAGGGRK